MNTFSKLARCKGNLKKSVTFLCPNGKQAVKEMRETILVMIPSRKSLAVYLNMEGKDLHDVHDKNLGILKKGSEEDAKR